MATPNPFDQFDAIPVAREVPPAPQANPFDQFDAQPVANTDVITQDIADQTARALMGNVVLPAPVQQTPEDSWGDVFNKLVPRLKAGAGSKVAGIQRFRADDLDAQNKLFESRLATLPQVISDWKQRPNRFATRIADDPRVIAAAQAAGVEPDAFVVPFPSAEELTPEKRAELVGNFHTDIIKQADLQESADAHRARVEQLNKDAQLNAGDWSPKTLLSEAIGTAPDLLAAAGGAMVGGPALGAGALVGEIAPTSYEEGRQKGYSQNDAAKYASLMTGAEFIGEVPVFEVMAKTPAGKALMKKVVGKYADKLIGKVAGTAVAEGVGEDITEALQIGIQTGLYDEKVSTAEALDRLAKAGVLGSILGGTMGGGAHLAEGKRDIGPTPAQIEEKKRIDAALGRTQHGARIEGEAPPSTNSGNSIPSESAPGTMPPSSSGESPSPDVVAPKVAPTRETTQGLATQPTDTTAPSTAPSTAPTETTGETPPAPTQAAPPSVAAEPTAQKTEVPPAQTAPPVSTPTPTPHVETVEQPGTEQVGGTTEPAAIEWQPHDKKAAVAPAPIATTGKPLTATVYRGSGKSGEQIYSGAQVPVAGEGGYYAFNPTDAANYGDTIHQGQATITNPLVITNDAQWRALTKNRAGWKYPNPTGQSEQTVKEWTAALRDVVTKDGHDGLVIQMDQQGDNAKTLRDVFDHDQIVDYRAPAPMPATAPASQTPVSKRETAPAKTQIEKLEASADVAEKEGDAPRAKQLREQANRLRKSAGEIEQNQPKKAAGKPESTESRLDQKIPGYTVEESNAPDDADSGITVEEGNDDAHAEFERLRQRQNQESVGTGTGTPERQDDSSGRGSRVVSPQGSRSEGTPTGDRSPRENRTTASEGKPLKAHRGAHSALAPEHFNDEALGFASGHPSSGLGVWFTNDKSETPRFGPIQSSHDVDLRNPRVYTPSDPIPGFSSLEEAAALRRSLKAQGYDGIVQDFRSVGGPVHFVAFDASQVKNTAAAVEPPSQAQMAKDKATDAEQAPNEFDLSDEFDEDTDTLESRAPETTEGQADDTLDLRRDQKKPIKSKPGPYSATREGEVRASAHEQIWKDAGLDPDAMELMEPPQRFAKAAEIVKQHFGFASVSKDKTLNWGEAIDVLKDAYVGLTNQAAIAGVNPAEMSLNGELHLLLKSNAGGALAYYQPGSKVIAMVRRNDAFAHEYGHAVDDWLLQHFAPELKPERGQLLSGKIRSGGTPTTLNAQVTEAFIDVMNALFFNEAQAALYVQDLQHKIATANTAKQKAAFQKQLDNFTAGHARAQGIESDYYKRAKKFDGGAFEPGGKDGYWQKPTEMFARAYEAWVANKIEGLGADHPFSTQSDRMYKESRTGQFRSVYPNEVDRQNIFAKMDTLMKAMRDNNLVNTKDAPAAIDATDTRYWKKQAPNLKPKQAAQARGVMARMVQPFKKAIAETKKADSAAHERSKQDKAIRDARLNAANRKGLRRWVSNVGLTVTDKLNIATASMAQSIRGLIFGLEEKHAGNKGIKQFRQWFATDPGSGEFTGQVFNEEVQTDERRFQGRFSNIVANHDIKSFDDQKLRSLRDVLVNAVPVDSVAPDVRAAAADLRRFLNDLYAYNQQNGVHIGYARNGYLPRVPDAMKIENDLDGFRKQANKLYSNVYETEIGSTETLMNNTGKLSSLLKYVKEIAKGGNVPTAKTQAQAQRQLAKDIVKLHRELTAAKKDPAKSKELEAMVDKLREAMRDPWATEAANDWEMRIRGIGTSRDFAFEARGPASKYAKSRTLPVEADAIMGDYLINDPLSLISTYISQSAKRVNYGKFFGNPKGDRPLGWKLDDALKSIREPYTAADGSTQRVNVDDAQVLEKAVNLLTGQFQTNMTSWGMRARSKFNSLMTPVILARSMWSQLAEPITVSIRSGDLSDGLRVVYKQMQDVAAKLGIKSAQQQAEWRSEMAEYFGIVTDHLTDQLMQSRYNLMYQTSGSAVKLARFFTIIGVHPHAMSMRRGAADIFMKRYAPKMAKRALTDTPKGKQAREALAELGIDTNNKELLAEMASLGEIQGLDALEKLRHLEVIRTAINRFVDEGIANPKIVDKPIWATQPETSFMYGIMSFQFAFQRNIMIGSAKRIGKAWENNPKVFAATTGSIAAGFGMLIAGQMASWIARSLLFNGDDWDDMKKKIDEDWLWQSMSRAGLFGAVDPIVNAFLSLKYERDLTALTAGPITGIPLAAAQTIGNFIGDSSSAVKAQKASTIVWNNGVAPLITAGALSIASANPYVDAALGVGLPFLTSKRVTGPITEWAAEKMTGKNYKTADEKRAESESDAGQRQAENKERNAPRRADAKVRREDRQRTEE
jgi:hypothetical protein